MTKREELRLRVELAALQLLVANLLADRAADDPDPLLWVQRERALVRDALAGHALPSTTPADAQLFSGEVEDAVDRIFGSLEETIRAHTKRRR